MDEILTGEKSVFKQEEVPYVEIRGARCVSKKSIVKKCQNQEVLKYLPD